MCEMMFVYHNEETINLNNITAFGKAQSPNSINRNDVHYMIKFTINNEFKIAWHFNTENERDDVFETLLLLTEAVPL